MKLDESIRKDISNKKEWYKQDISEEELENLVGNVVYVHGTVGEYDHKRNLIGRKNYSYEALIIGYSKEVLFDTDNTKVYKYALLTNEGIANAIVSDMVFEIIEKRK